MGKTNKCNLRKDETLAGVVKKYQYLYDFPTLQFSLSSH